MDRRTTAATGTIAAAHLRGLVPAQTYVEPTAYRVAMVVTDLLAAPEGDRERQLLRGETFWVVHVENGMAFGYADKDGYVGWLDFGDVLSHPSQDVTHTICAPRSYAKSSPGLKTNGATTPLPYGAQLVVIDENEGWSRIAWDGGRVSRDLFVPTAHLKPKTHLAIDAAAEAIKFLGTPYLWGGNSSFGIDCSGLVQAALLASGTPCPGDSDLQQTAFPDAIGDYQRGDLLFWKGHVAMITDPQNLIHANAFHMAVAIEPIQDAFARIQLREYGAVTAHKRPNYEAIS